MNQFPSRAEVERIRSMFPTGMRIELVSMHDEPYPLPKGSKGTVQGVDDSGAVLMKWDCGRSLSLIWDKDVFRKIGMENAPVAERYPLLFGSAIDGNRRLHNIQEVAEFICKHGQSGDVRITTNDGFELLDTFGIYINKISDMEYRQELLKVLIPMQHEVEIAAFSDDESMDETEDMDMTM